MLPAESVTQHVIACKNFFIGSCNLLIIGLPTGWRLQKGPFPAEVDHWMINGEYCWATVGRGSYRFHAPQPEGRGWQTLDARLHMERSGTGAARSLAVPAAALATVAESGSMALGGHEARWALGAVRRGLRRAPYAALAVSLECPETRRQVRLIVEGPDPAVLRRALTALSEALICH